MKERILISMSAILVLLLSGCSIDAESMETHNNQELFPVGELLYDEAMSAFTEVDVDGIKRIQENGMDFFLYVGRDSCLYCREFVPKLVEAFADLDMEIYYLDSIDSYDNSSQELKDFRDLHGIELIPSFLRFEGSEVVEVLEISDGITIEEIAGFISHK